MAGGAGQVLEYGISHRFSHFETPGFERVEGGVTDEYLEAEPGQPLSLRSLDRMSDEGPSNPTTVVFRTDMDLRDTEALGRVRGLHPLESRQTRSEDGLETLSVETHSEFRDLGVMERNDSPTATKPTGPSTSVTVT